MTTCSESERVVCDEERNESADRSTTGRRGGKRLMVDVMCTHVCMLIGRDPTLELVVLACVQERESPYYVHVATCM